MKNEFNKTINRKKLKTGPCAFIRMLVPDLAHGHRHISQNSGAADTQKLFRHSIRLLPVLARRGVPPCDALAVAFNAAFLFYNLPRTGFMLSPKTILRKYSYAEIASLCEHLLGTAEYAVNENFKEDWHERKR